MPLKVSSAKSVGLSVLITDDITTTKHIVHKKWTRFRVVVHYNDVIMSTVASQITSVFIVCSTAVQAQIKENIKVPRHWPLCGESTCDRWIPRTEHQ